MNSDVSIPDLPPAEIYELEFQYWPWGQLIKQVENWVAVTAPPRSFVMDYMCGSGYLLDAITTRRADLRCAGVTASNEDVAFAKRRRPSSIVTCGDATSFQPAEPVDIAIATGGIHHLVPSLQVEFVAKVARDLRSDGYFLVGEEVVPPFASEKDRRLGVLELGKALMAYVVNSNAPSVVLEAAIDVTKRDLFAGGEYKTSLSELTAVLETAFLIEALHKTWPSDTSSYGDYFLVCRPKNRENISG